MLVDVVADGFVVYCCGPRAAPNALVASYEWDHCIDLLTIRLSSRHQCTTRLDLGRGLVRSSANREGTHLPLIRPDVSPRESPRSSRVVHSPLETKLPHCG